MKPDEELMMEYVLGSQEALEEIFQRYRRAMLNYALRLLKTRADAEDVVGEVFYALTYKKQAYQPQVAKFSTWLYTIAHNACINRIRSRAKIVFLWAKRDKDSAQYEELDIPDTRELADERLEQEDSAAYVKKAVAKLPLEQREAIILRQYQDLSYEQIAQVLQCSVNKVKVLIFRARERLRQELLPYMREAGNE